MTPEQTQAQRTADAEEFKDNPLFKVLDQYTSDAYVLTHAQRAALRGTPDDPFQQIAADFVKRTEDMRQEIAKELKISIDLISRDMAAKEIDLTRHLSGYGGGGLSRRFIRAEHFALGRMRGMREVYRVWNADLLVLYEEHGMPVPDLKGFAFWADVWDRNGEAMVREWF